MRHSRRAALFAEILTYVNADDWERGEGFVVFGKQAFDEYLDRLAGEVPDESSDFRESLWKLVSRVREDRGKRAVDQRISVQPATEELTDQHVRDWATGLTASQRELMVRAGESLLSGSEEERAAIPPAPVATIDDMDAAMAAQMVQVLDQAVNRVGSFDPVDLEGQAAHPEYFEEAHRCDLYGLKIAAAVLCRAVLEEGLKQVIDPQGELRRAASVSRRAPAATGRERSHILRMIDEAGNRPSGRGHLDQERRQKAKRIKESGDLAIHNPSEFRSKYAAKMRDIVDDTRKVIIDLFSRN